MKIIAEFNNETKEADVKIEFEKDMADDEKLSQFLVIMNHLINDDTEKVIKSLNCNKEEKENQLDGTYFLLEKMTKGALNSRNMSISKLAFFEMIGLKTFIKMK